MKSCGCVSPKAKQAFKMLVVAAARRRLRGQAPSIRLRGKVPVRTLLELQKNGYLTADPSTGGFHVTDAGLRKLDEWQALGMI